MKSHCKKQSRNNEKVTITRKKCKCEMKSYCEKQTCNRENCHNGKNLSSNYKKQSQLRDEKRCKIRPSCNRKKYSFYSEKL